jgi:hypothetical protein
MESPQTLESSPTRSYRFSFRAIPRGAIAEHLAATRVLVCDRASGAGQPWSGTATIAVGSLRQNIEATPMFDVIFAACPVTAAEFKGAAHIP